MCQRISQKYTATARQSLNTECTRKSFPRLNDSFNLRCTPNTIQIIFTIIGICSVAFLLLKGSLDLSKIIYAHAGRYKERLRRSSEKLFSLRKGCSFFSSLIFKDLFRKRTSNKIWTCEFNCYFRLYFWISSPKRKSQIEFFPTLQEKSTKIVQNC